ncbi:hypothetical protein [Siphonobacter sp. SORGH_AS_1065]|uniref:hypothetical protein n=1 Tax=Siphonobacter sp. SORGH_AS_1065 TaxID=3041795 RepID=UPI0027892088|nr:hypothetical protein [Siphonobacter sp. SORGH_AS_1065]MDQ1090460.1 putative membrane protein [Siphonobacter sp. SORGH_AS_1065]
MSKKIILKGRLLIILSLLTAQANAQITSYLLKKTGFTNGGFDTILNFVFLMVGVLSMFYIVPTFRKYLQGDSEAGRRAINFGLSILLCLTLMMIVKLLYQDSQTIISVHIGKTLSTSSGMISDQKDAISKLVFVIIGIIAFMVLPNKYKSLQEGDFDAGKQLITWGLSLFAVAVLNFFISHYYFN